MIKVHFFIEFSIDFALTELLIWDSYTKVNVELQEIGGNFEKLRFYNVIIKVIRVIQRIRIWFFTENAFSRIYGNYVQLYNYEIEIWVRQSKLIQPRGFFLGLFLTSSRKYVSSAQRREDEKEKKEKDNTNSRIRASRVIWLMKRTMTGSRRCISSRASSTSPLISRPSGPRNITR